jgi:hypothetical protein
MDVCVLGWGMSSWSCSIVFGSLTGIIIFGIIDRFFLTKFVLG